MSAPRFAAALFDVDGTLLDSADFVIGAIEHVLRERGRTPPPRDQIGRALGPALADCYRVLVPDLDAAELVAAHREWQRQRARTVPVRPYPHAVETLRELRAAGVRCGAVTARSKVSSLGTLEGAGFGGLLDVVVSAEDTARTKPYPDPLLVALQHMKLAPSRAIFVGDTEADIVAGRAAGICTVGALYGFWGEALATAKPDYLIRDIAELTQIVLGG
ncbi:MAG: HAD-IA family hydrolase [Verrucomicrobiae bacterium]|nr:HAD-IA family hydrolase [Verrucomicrobiae bacterium]